MFLDPDGGGSQGGRRAIRRKPICRRMFRQVSTTAVPLTCEHIDGVGVVTLTGHLDIGQASARYAKLWVVPLHETVTENGAVG